MARRRLSKSDLKELNEKIAVFSLVVEKKDAVEILDDADGTFYLVNGAPWLFEEKGKLIPHLKAVLGTAKLLPRVTVDAGAVKFVVNGADVMRPGVVSADEGIAKGDIVAVVEATHGKALAVGEALFDTKELLAATGGKVVKSLHHVGDKRWTKEF